MRKNREGRLWQVKATADRNTIYSRALCAVSTKCLHECPSRQWQIQVSGKQVSQPSVSVSTISEEEVGAYLAEMDAAGTK